MNKEYIAQVRLEYDAEVFVTAKSIEEAEDKVYDLDWDNKQLGELVHWEIVGSLKENN